MCGLLYHNEGGFHGARKSKIGPRRETYLLASLYAVHQCLTLPYISWAGYNYAEYEADHKGNQQNDYECLYTDEHACPPSYSHERMI